MEINKIGLSEEKLEFLKNKLTKETYTDLIEFLANGENSFYLMGHMDDTEKVISVPSIIERFQTVSNPKYFGYAKSINDWQKNNNFKNHIEIPSYNKLGYFMPFMFAESDNKIGKVNYPLLSTLIDDNGTQNCPNYANIKESISKAFSIKIIEKGKQVLKWSKSGNKEPNARLKNKKFSGFLKYNASKALQICKTVFTLGFKKYNHSKLDKIKNAKIYLTQYDNINEEFISEVDKLISIFSKLARRATQLSSKKYNNISNEPKTIFLAQLISILNISKSIGFGNIEIDKKVNEALSLQISNVVASMSTNSTDIQLACKISADATGYILTKMNKSPSSIAEGSARIGKPVIVDSELPTYYDVMFAKQDQTALINRVNEEIQKYTNKYSATTTKEQNQNISQKFNTKAPLKPTTLTREKASSFFDKKIDKAVQYLYSKTYSKINKENLTNKEKDLFKSNFYKNIRGELIKKKEFNFSRFNPSPTILFTENILPSPIESYSADITDTTLKIKESFLNKYFEGNKLKEEYKDKFKTADSLFKELNFTTTQNNKTLYNKLKSHISFQVNAGIKNIKSSKKRLQKEKKSDKVITQNL